MTDAITQFLVGRRAEYDDVCALPLIRRVAAILDRDLTLEEGDILPRGWHTALFTPVTRQSDLGKDGVPQASVLVPNPDPAQWPRKMFGGRRTQFLGDVCIGSRVRRESEIITAKIKEARSGKLLIVTVRSCIFEKDGAQALIIEEQDHIFRGAPSSNQMQVEGRQDPPPLEASIRQPLVIDSVMLFRYSAVTFNAHRIHFDFPYTTQQEGYPGLLVNGALPALLALDMVREHLTHAPTLMTARNVRPVYCDEQLHLCAAQRFEDWFLWVENHAGETALHLNLQ